MKFFISYFLYICKLPLEHNNLCYWYLYATVMQSTVCSFSYISEHILRYFSFRVKQYGKIGSTIHLSNSTMEWWLNNMQWSQQKKSHDNFPKMLLQEILHPGYNLLLVQNFYRVIREIIMQISLSGNSTPIFQLWFFELIYRK